MSVGIDSLRGVIGKIKKIEKENYNVRQDKLITEDRKKAAREIKEIEEERKQINKEYDEKIKVIKADIPKKRSSKTPPYIKKLDHKIDRLLEENKDIKKTNKQLQEELKKVKKENKKETNRYDNRNNR